MLVDEMVSTSDLFYEHLAKMGNHFVIITDSNVKRLYGTKLKKKLLSHGFKVDLIAFEAGEQNKNRQTKAMIEDTMLSAKIGSDATLIALGGGVTTDIGGFISATYLRGIPLVSIPTTLMGMVDAAHGNKNGVNTPFGKNSLGTYYPPSLIVVDPTYLNTLTAEEIQNGLSEVIKYGAICDDQLFWHIDEYGLNPLKDIIERSIRHKYRIIMQPGMRNILNFGHTIGHAIEQATNYAVSHGQAIAIGMCVESGNLEIEALFEKLGYNLSLPNHLSKEKVKKALYYDKKRIGNQIEVTQLRTIGEASLEWVDIEKLEGVIDEMFHHTYA